MYFKPSLVPVAVALCMLLVVGRVAWHLSYLVANPAFWLLMPIWVITLVMPTLTLFVSWFDKPYTVNATQQAFLDSQWVTMIVPVFNEDPLLLHLALLSFMQGTRRPDEIFVIENGINQDRSDYSRVRAWWTDREFSGTIIQWARIPEKGKKVGQAWGMARSPKADYFMTVDSDTRLEREALREGLKPLIDPDIASVALIEEVFNKRVNWLTMTCAVRNSVSQLIAWSTQSVFGDVLINRGTGAIYRAENIRPILTAYLEETFLGVPIKLGDDSALTLFSKAHGKTVQQVSAFSLPMYPERMRHHLGQWLRWARGGSVRNYWRIKYLSPLSWSWWWIALGLYFIPISLAVPIMYAVTWPASARVIGYIGILMISWAYAVCPRSLRVHRQGESRWFRTGQMLLYPFGIMWTSLALRPVRLYGVVTWFRQGWVTRGSGVEVTAHDDGAEGAWL